MPSSHVEVTVSNQAASCSFFLSALAPLGYRYVGQQGNHIGLGVQGNDAQLFICQKTAGYLTCLLYLPLRHHSC